MNEENLDIAIEYYKNHSGITVTECAKIHNIKRHTLDRALKKSNIPVYSKRYAILNGKKYINVSTTRSIRHKFNENYFDIIDTEEKAYWLGFLLADGAIVRNSLEIALNIRDYDHLWRLKKALSATYFIREYEYQGYKRCQISFSSHHLLETLAKYNIIPNKKNLGKKPYLHLKNDLVKHYIRGFFDGDGCISRAKRDENRVRYCFEIASNIEMLSFIKKYFIKNNINVSDIKKHMSIFEIRTSSNVEIIKIYDLLYKNSNIFLPRKIERFMEVCRIYSILDNE